VKNAPIHVSAKTVFVVDIQQEVGKLFLSVTSCPSTIIFEDTSNWCIEEMLLW
jgi:hypothetical protein